MLALLTNAAFYVIPFLVIITLIVTIHELGHFLTARAFGVAVDRFSIGFGPTLAAIRDKWGVEWRIAWLPLGGYVRFSGDDNAASVPDQADLAALRSRIIDAEGPGSERRYFYFKPLWQRALVVLAGPAANFLLAIALFALLFGTLGDAVTRGPISKVAPGSAAERAGFLAGDTIIAADGHWMRGFQDLREYVAYRDGVTIDFTVQRGQQVIHLLATPALQRTDSIFGGKESGGQLGVWGPDKPPTIIHYNPIEAIGMGVRRTWDAVSTTAFYLGRIVTGHAPANQLHGLIGIVRATGGVAKQAAADAPPNPWLQSLDVAVSMVSLGAVLSVTVGIANLLPIPVLDGGHLLFYAYESVVRRPLSANMQAAGYRLGLALLFGMMLFANWNDLLRQPLFRFLGGHSS